LRLSTHCWNEEYFSNVLTFHCQLIGAEKLLSFASLIAKKAKSGASKHVEELVRQLLGTASRLRAELRADVLVHAGILYRNLGKSAVESIPLFREAVALKPNSIVAWLQLAKSLNVDNFEHKQEALSAVQKVLEIDPNNPKAIATWGNILIGPNSFNEPPETFKELSTAARAKYIEAYKLDPKAANWISCKSAAEFGQKHLVVLLQTILEIPELASKLSAGFAKLRAGGTLVITELPELTDDMLLAFAAAGPHTLSRIRLLRCTSITDVGVNALIESCKVHSVYGRALESAKTFFF
jgi:tetratricopeptide (TPR) repeat protein